MQIQTLKQRNQTIQRVTRITKAVIDASWIPEALRGNSFFGLYDFWIYEDENAESECDYCKTYAGQLFTGNQLRNIFPDLIPVSSEEIRPNVHQTLWHTDTCKCKLTRVPFESLPKDWVIYSGERTPHYVKPEDRESYYSYTKTKRSV